MNKSIGDVLIAAVLVFVGWPGSVLGAEVDYAALRQQAAERLDAFRKQTTQAADAGMDVARERVTITTAELFLKYADWDAEHPDELQAAMGYVFLGHSQMPKWVLEKHSEIKVGSRHFTAYDIDHPVTREVWQALLAKAVPQFAGRKVSQSGYLLANEPHWFSGTDQWDTGPVSDYTQAKLRTWLQQQHGTIAALNRLWGTEFSSFADVTIEVPVDTALRGTPIWYDWCRFNMHRVTDWFVFLKTQIRRHDPAAKSHIKLIPRHFSQGQRSHGLDFETLIRLQEIIGCDAKVINAPNRVEQDDFTDRYACDWRNLAMPYDFFRSVSPDKLLFDSEFHGLSTVHWRDPDMPPEYVRCIYWLAHLHGLGMNQTWYWSRGDDGAPDAKSLSGFYASNLTMPRVMNAFGRTMKELNAFAPEVVALATEPKHIRLFYSETAAIQDADYMDRLHETYRSLYHHGLPLGFVTGRMLQEAGEEQLRAWPVVVVPHANHITIGELKARETNAVGQLGCVWRTSPWEDGHVLLVINLGKTEAQLAVTGTSGTCRDMLTDSPHPVDFALGPFGVKLLHVR